MASGMVIGGIRMIQHQNAAQFQLVWAILAVLAKVVATLGDCFG